MTKALLTLVIMTGLICAHSAANTFECYGRTNVDPNIKGSATTCDQGQCYAYTKEKKQFAGCGQPSGTDAPTTYRFCKISKCNEKIIPTDVDRVCHYWFNATTEVGLEEICADASSKCYSYKSATNQRFAGCGDCKPEFPKPCFSCTGDNCNKDYNTEQVKRKCYERSGTTAAEIGSSKPCLIDNKPETHCYSYSDESKQFAGCGKCPAGTKSAFKCEDCEKDDCNKEIVKSVICYKLPEETDRSQIYNPSKNSNVLCRSQDKCHHYTNSDKKKVADCGPCPTGVSDCKDCTSDYCNGNSKLVATGSATIIGILMLVVMKLGF